jgi:hypothetical protein
MAAEHSAVLKLAQIRATQEGARIFQNPIGLGFVGEVIEEYESSAGHIITLKHARRIQFGVCNPGGFDLIGWKTERVYDRFGQPFRVAIFTAIDGKTDGYRSMSKDQKNFARELAKAGGIVQVARRSIDGETVDFYEAGPEDPHGRD